jgi:hypothetical protein
LSGRDFGELPSLGGGVNDSEATFAASHKLIVGEKGGWHIT